jgi:hypothetical protein
LDIPENTHDVFLVNQKLQAAYSGASRKNSLPLNLEGCRKEASRKSLSALRGVTRSLKLKAVIFMPGRCQIGL